MGQIAHDEYRLKCVTELRKKIGLLIKQKKNSIHTIILLKQDMPDEEFSKLCFNVTALGHFEDYLKNPWSFLEIYEQDVYRLSIEDIEMMLFDAFYDPTDKYLMLCDDSKGIIPLSDDVIRDELIDALDTLMYKKFKGKIEKAKE